MLLPCGNANLRREIRGICGYALIDNDSFAFETIVITEV